MVFHIVLQLSVFSLDTLQWGNGVPELLLYRFAIITEIGATSLQITSNLPPNSLQIPNRSQIYEELRDFSLLVGKTALLGTPTQT